MRAKAWIHTNTSPISRGKSFCIALALAAIALPGAERAAWAQTPLDMATIGVRYSTAKRRQNPAPEIMAQLAAVEAKVLPLRQAGRFGEVRRCAAELFAILGQEPWDAVAEYNASLVLRTEMAVCDPGQPLVARLTQLYSALPELQSPQSPLSAEISYHSLKPLGRTRVLDETLKDFGTFTGVARDLIETPFAFSVDLEGLEQDGALAVALFADGEQIHQIWTPINPVKNLSSRRSEMESRLQSLAGHEEAKTSIRYPFDFAMTVNLGQAPIKGFDFAGGIEASENLLAELESGHDPFHQATGHLRRNYYFEEAREIMPYELYVPSSYYDSPGKKWPLAMVLHGLGGTQSTFMARGDGSLQEIAEDHGYIVATPLGYRPDAGYGRVNTVYKDKIRASALGEKDVLNVLSIVREKYNVDSDRIYLMGHSMGGTGTWLMGVKHAEIWAALGPSAPGISPSGPAGIDITPARDIPVHVLHGSEDTVCPVENSRAMADRMEQLGMNFEYVEIEGATHSSHIGVHLPEFFKFFDKHKKNAK